jgi:hypothetical protein
VPVAASYVLPVRWPPGRPLDEPTAYLRWLSREVQEVLVVDGSPADAFDAHHRAWRAIPGVAHVRPDPDLAWANGKVNGVVTGLRRAACERVVLADDDVRYDATGLARVVGLLDRADLVAPQNHFRPLPWHARWDTARTLVNRALGADFPGTLAVRRAAVLATGGYDGDVVFENLELLRTVEASGGTVRNAPDCFVPRLPPTARHFLSQRVRQAYDDLARPARLAAALSVGPLALLCVARRRWGALAAGGCAVIAVAERGRRRAGGRHVFPAGASLLAPAWVAERAVCSWVALALWASGRGCGYAGRRIRRAATPPGRLRRRYAYSAGVTGSDVMSARGITSK